MSEPNETRLWFVTDVRGSSDVFGKILNVVRHRSDVFKKPDIVLLSGNLTGGETCVIGLDENRRAYVDFRGARCSFASESERDRRAAIFEKTFGAYVIEESLRIDNDSLDSMRIERIRSWLDLIRRVLVSGEGARFLIVPGPDDPPNIETLLSGVPGLEVCDNKAVEINDELALACSSALTYPEAVNQSRRPRRYCRDRAEYVAHIQQLISRPTDPRTKWLLNLYMPPRNTTLDLCTQTDDEGVPIAGPAGPEMCYIGSEPVRECIERFKPVASFHSYPPFEFRTATIGRTRLIAPGTEAFAGYAIGAWLTFSGGRLTASEPTREELSPDHWLLTASEGLMELAFKSPLDIAGVIRRAWESQPNKPTKNKAALDQSAQDLS